MKLKIVLPLALIFSGSVFAQQIPDTTDYPTFSAGLDLGFNWNSNNNSIATDNENKSSSFIISPQAWIGLNSQYTFVPSFGFGFYNSQNNNSSFNNSFSERSLYPSLALLRYCDDPCDDYEFFTGVRLAGQFFKGTSEYEQISNQMKSTTDSKTTGFTLGGVAGINYNFTDKFTGFISSNVIQYNRSKQINDIKSEDNYNTFSGFSFGRDVRLGARFIF
ncbi:MAG: hypothetical protein ACKVQB_02145 [Bacteroidia bacterium]